MEHELSDITFLLTESTHSNILDFLARYPEYQDDVEPLDTDDLRPQRCHTVLSAPPVPPLEGASGDLENVEALRRLTLTPDNHTDGLDRSATLKATNASRDNSTSPSIRVVHSTPNMLITHNAAVTSSRHNSTEPSITHDGSPTTQNVNTNNSCSPSKTYLDHTLSHGSASLTTPPRLTGQRGYSSTNSINRRFKQDVTDL